MIKTIYFLLLTTAINASTPTNPVHAKTTILCPVIADATYNIRRMNMNFTELSGFNTSQDALNLANTFSNILTGYSALDKTYTYMSQGIFEMSANSVGGGMAISTIISHVAANLASQNTQYRFFAFYVPVSGPYSLSVSMPGDPIIRPNNKFSIHGGSYDWGWEGQLSSDRINTFDFNNLEEGQYIIMIGLGTTSSWFHTAGRLSNVQFNSQITKNWTSKSIVGVAHYNGTSLMPNVGNTAQVSLQYLPVPVNTNIIDGSVSYSNYSTHTIFQSTSYNDAWTWKSGAGRWVEFPTFDCTSSSINGSNAIFTLRRVTNEYEWITQE